MIKFQCECGRKIAAPDQWLGKRVKCPQCGKPVLVQQSVAVASALQPQPMAVPPQVMEPEHSSESDASPDSGFGRNEHTDQNERSEHDEHVEHSEHSEQNQDGEHGEEREPQDAPPMISPFSNARNGGDYSGPATTPETHFFVPPASSSSQGLPKPNVVPTLDPQHYYDDEASWGRWPRNFGIMSLLVGAVAAGLYFIPATSSAGTFVAGAGALLAIIGIVLSLRQDRAAFPWPAIALFVSIVAGGLPWLMPLIIGDQTPPAAINSNRRPPKEDPSEADKEARRRMFISVDSMLLVNDRNGLATDIEYRLTNKSGKAIARFEGSVQVSTIVDHKPITGLGLGIDFGKTPFPIGSSLAGRKTWSLDPGVRELLAQKQAGFDYRATSITFVDGTQENFDH